MVVRLLLSVASFLALIAVGTTQATACEKHLNGHQNSSETTTEAQSR